MPPSTVFHICEVCIPHAWKTIEEGVNDKLYLQASRNGGAIKMIYYIAAIDANNHDGNGFKLALYSAAYAICLGISISCTPQNQLLISVASIVRGNY